MSETIIGVIIGGLIAVVPQIIIAIINWKKEKINNKKDAYKKLISVVYQIKNWHSMVFNEREFYKQCEECKHVLVLFCPKYISELMNELVDEYNKILELFQETGELSLVSNQDNELMAKCEMVLDFIRNEVGNK